VHRLRFSSIGTGSDFSALLSSNITVRTFPAGKARNRALTILGLVGSVSYSIGVIIGGLFETASWRWLLRMFSVLSFIAAGIAVLVVPKQRIHKNLNMREIVLRMDLIGLIFSIGTILLLVLALTSGPEYGWNDPRFYVCFPVSLLSGVAFFFWEAKGIKEIHAMLPAAIWETPTVKPLVFLK
jgi:MFS family permease